MSMNSYKKITVRFVTALSCLMFASTAAFFPVAVPQAFAQAPVVITNPDIIIGTAATAKSTFYSATIKPVLDGLQWAVAKAAIQAITKSMVNWINSGFNGSPAFVTNLDQNLLGVSDGVANSFFNALSNNTSGGIKSPFQSVVSQQLRNSYYSSTGRSGGSGYNLNQYSKNPAAFLAGKFGANGGFNAWFAAVGNNQNNPYGAAYAQQNALNAAVYKATTNRLNELNWGKGFMSWRGPCTSSKPTANTNSYSIDAQGYDTVTSLANADTCTSYSIKTPGSIIEDSLGITATSPLRQLELSNSINQIVGALASQLINQVVGATGLSGISQPSSGGGSSPLSQATNPSQYSQTGLANGFVQSVTNDLANAQSYLLNWQKLQSLAKSCISTNPTVVAAVTQTDTNVTRAAHAINALNKVNTEAVAVSASIDPTQLAAVSAEYQGIVSTTSGAYITQQDFIDSQIQSSPATGGSPSLFTTLSGICGTNI